MMARTPTANVVPELLVWARESIGYSPEEAATKLHQPVERLLAWESGEARPTIAQLRAAANVYKRPLAVFYLSEPPLTFQAMRDFRRLPSDEAVAYSPELHLAIRRARARREVALDLLREAGDEPTLPSVPAESADSFQGLAEAARELLGVPLEEQWHWKDRYKALRGWTTALENAGVLVFQTSEVDLTETRGFSITDSPLAVIVANAKDSPRGRVFTLMHEFAHILLRDGGLCDLRDAEETHLSPERRTEVFCNQVAAEVLVPMKSLLVDVEGYEKRRDGIWSDDDLESLSVRYSVSREVILRRLLTLGLTTERFYQQKRAEYLEAYARQPAKEGRPSYHRIQVRDLGRAYLGIVLDAYHREAINSSDLSEYLGVRLKHVPRLEQEAFGAV
jgi:Zn-dependent peptidase ImmA (M78 family)